MTEADFQHVADVLEAQRFIESDFKAAMWANRQTIFEALKVAAGATANKPAASPNHQPRGASAPPIEGKG
jgi:hypothetical protein